MTTDESALVKKVRATYICMLLASISVSHIYLLSEVEDFRLQKY